jgi:hypothetical protein
LFHGENISVVRVFSLEHIVISGFLKRIAHISGDWLKKNSRGLMITTGEITKILGPLGGSGPFFPNVTDHPRPCTKPSIANDARYREDTEVTLGGQGGKKIIVSDSTHEP